VDLHLGLFTAVRPELASFAWIVRYWQLVYRRTEYIMEDETRGPSHIGSGRITDEDRLAELGYKQELTRNWSLLHNFGVSFSIIVSQ